MKTMELWVYERDALGLGEPQTIVHGFNCSIESVETAKEYADKNFAVELDVLMVIPGVDGRILVSSRYAGMGAKWLDANPFPIRGRGRPSGTPNKVPSAANTRLLVKGLKWIRQHTTDDGSRRATIALLAHLACVDTDIVNEAFLSNRT